MSGDAKFLEKYLYFNEQLARASDQYDTKSPYLVSELCGLSPRFCDMVIRKSKFVGSDSDKIPIFDSYMTLEQLCGEIPDTDSANRYWRMTSNIILVDDLVIYEMQQVPSAMMCVKLYIQLEDFNKFLTYLFSYVDNSCIDNDWGEQYLKEVR